MLPTSVAVSSYDRKFRMLLPLAQTCMACSMCDLGFREVVKGDERHDPHVFSNFQPKRFMVVGQNPGYNEVREKMPFVGDAGKIFDTEIQKYGLTRLNFYITNAVKCFTAGNTRPTAKHMERCEPFLRMEINLIKPRLVIALGAVAFDQLCPAVPFTESLRKIVKSTRYGVSVFPIYHPSPLNLQESSRLLAFQQQIKLMCAIVGKLKEAHSEE
jgi:uracil-DNA glycosylase family 4